MKTKTIFLHLTGTFVLSYLFYEQNAGINLSVFTLVLIAILAIYYPLQAQKKQWLLAALLSLTCSCIVLFNASLLSVIICLLSWLILIYCALNERLSIISGGFYAAASMLGGFWIWLTNKFLQTNSTTLTLTTKTKTGFKLHYAILPFCGLVLFFLLYRQVSPAFADVTNHIDLSFISIGWLCFTFVGYMFLFGLFHIPREIEFMSSEIEIGNQLENDKSTNNFGFYYTGIILFYTLNVLLFFVVFSDVIYLLFQMPVKKSMSYSDMIHQGIDALIFSLAAAVVFILIWFRYKSPVNKMHKSLAIGAIIWAILNVFLVVINVYKNRLYIDAHGLTYLRIGVYFSLFLALSVILTCIYKIIKNKNNWFMYRSFGFTILTISLVFNFFNWDKIIVQQNIECMKHKTAIIEVNYLLELSPETLPLIYDNWTIINPNNDEILNRKLSLKTFRFMENYAKFDWRSKSLNDYYTYNYLSNSRLVKNLYETKKIVSN